MMMIYYIQKPDYGYSQSLTKVELHCIAIAFNGYMSVWGSMS